MKVVCGFALAWIFMCGTLLSQSASDEITLYGASGKPVAYIADDDDSTIYLWSGKPVAYLKSEDVYGFNGKHLGWFVKGLIYNHDGEIVGATRSRLKVAAQVSPIKSLKELKPLKGLKELKPLKPIFSMSWSEDETLRSFLLIGSDD
jgi:hypothetical protein